MTPRREPAVLAIAVALGVAVAAVAPALESLARIPTWTPPAPVAASTTQFELPPAPHPDRVLLDEIRALVRQGRAEDALSSLRARRVQLRGSPVPVLELEWQALSLVLTPETFRADMNTQSSYIQPPPAAAPVAMAALAYVPDGLGVAGDPGRAHARAFVTAVAVAAGGGSYRRRLAGPFATLVAHDAGRLVDVLLAWADLLPYLEQGDVLVEDERVRRDVCIDLCQALLDAGCPRETFDALCGIARDAARPPRERAVAAMALAELADLPLGLGAGLPRDDADATTFPVDAITGAWERLRDLAPQPGLVARVELALHGSGGGPAHSWLVWRLGRGVSEPPTVEVARDIAAGRLEPERYLSEVTGAGPDLGDREALLERMERDELLAPPLHHLLVLRGEPRDAPPPRFAASTATGGIARAWRTAFGLRDVPFVLRVARLERRLDGVTLLGESQRVVREGEITGLSWSESVPDRRGTAVSWTFPGMLPEPAATVRLDETLELAVTWTDLGAQVRVENLRCEVQHSAGGGSSSTSGTTWRVGFPVGWSPWAGSHSVASGRSYLLLVQRAEGEGPEWTLDDWRSATSEALKRLQAAANESPYPHHARQPAWMLGEALALLRTPVDARALAQLDLMMRGLGPGTLRALAFAGEGALVEAGPLPGSRVPTAEARSLTARDAAEIALDAPDADTRDVMSALLGGSGGTDLPPELADELLDLEEAQPGRVPARLQDVAGSTLAGRGVRRDAVPTTFALVAWGWAIGLLGLVALTRRRAHRGRGFASGLLITAIAIAQLGIVVRGADLTPGWAGWGLAALAVTWTGRGLAPREAGVAAAAFAVAAVASAAGPFAGTAADTLAAAFALAGCCALAPLGPALVDGLTARTRTVDPRRAVRRLPWGLALRAGLGAAVSGALVVGATSLRWDQIVQVAAYVVPVAVCLGGLVLWRLALASDQPRTRLPLLFVLGLVTPGVALLAGETLARAGLQRPLAPDVSGPLLMAVAGALVFVLLRVLDAARIRGRADSQAARVTS